MSDTLRATDQDVTALLSATLADPTLEVPAEVVEAARAVVLDGVACLVAGAREPAGDIATWLAATSGGTAESSVAGFSQKVDAPDAAFANGVAMHALDFEAVGSPACHGTSSVFPALLALAERESISGLAVLDAFVLGWEVECRLRTAAGVRDGFHPTAVYGPIAAAAASAALLGLDAQGVENAIAYAASSSGGLAANGTSMVKTAHAGNAARTGVTAVLLAREGFAGAKGVLERPRGFGDAFLVDPDWTAVVAPWGERWFLTEPGVNFKPYPVQFPMLNIVDTAIDALAAGVRPGDIERIDITASQHIAARSNPRPHGGHGGKFSPEYCAAIALLTGGARIEDFTDERAADPAVLSMIDRIHVTAKPAHEGGKRDVAFSVRRSDGSHVVVERTRQRGSIADPLSREQRVAKARMCLRTTVRDSLAEDIIGVAERFETVDDVHTLGQLLRG